MLPSRFRTAGKLAPLLVLVSAACSDGPTPTAPSVEPSAGLLDGALDLLGGATAVEVLERTTPLSEDEVVSEVVGPRGGVIHLPRSGLAVFIPPRALTSATRITVTAPAGDLVGYFFEPHGLEFDRDVTVVQDLSGTEAELLDVRLGLTAAYFTGPLAPVVQALELLEFDVLGMLPLGSFEIEHFSGYVVATNRGA